MSSLPRVQNAVTKFFQSVYFDENKPLDHLFLQFISLIQNATVSDLVCIEEIMNRLKSDENKFATSKFFYKVWLKFVDEFLMNPTRQRLYVIRVIACSTWIEQVKQDIYNKIKEYSSIELIPELCQFWICKKGLYLSEVEKSMMEEFILTMLIENTEDNPMIWIQAME